MNKRTIAIFFLAAAVVIPYVVAGWNEQPVDDAFRAQAPGQFVQLSDGQIHYQWLGDKTGEVVVLLHGVSVPSYVFAQSADALVESGFRVLLFDHFGHGFSDRPAADYGATFFRRQTIDLFDQLNLSDPVHVVGYSMGGVIAIDFAARHPERLKSLSLIAPAGIRLVNTEDSTFVKVIKWPLVGHWLWRIVARGYYFPEEDDTAVVEKAPFDEKLQGDPVRQADHEGYLSAQRQIFRNLQLGNRDDLLQIIDESDIPVTGIFGDNDKTIHIDSAAVLKEIIPRARVRILQGGTHHLIIHRWREVHDALVVSIDAQRSESRSISNNQLAKVATFEEL